MAKKKSVYTCQSCGYESSGWLGKCPSCQKFNTFVEETPVSAAPEGAKPSLRAGWIAKRGVESLSEVSSEETPRFSSGLPELDRILGGGFVEGSLTLVGGDPGIGKSTLLMQVSDCCDRKGEILYVSGEESMSQIRMRADRLGVKNPKISLCSQTSFEYISEVITERKPALCIIDSIQTLYSEDISAAPGSVSQAREVTAGLLRLAKALLVPIVLVGHVTKDGAIAGPRVLEHMVDTVLYFEGDGSGAFRLIRATKNRFGATGEVAFFEMTQTGLKGVENASAILLSGRPMGAPGSVITSTMEGTRAIFVEIQALLSPSTYANPQRMTQGLDRSRVGMLLAILENKAKVMISGMDAYINVIGGIRIDETACDLAVILAVFSATQNKPLRGNTLVVGEVGLTGEIRPVSDMEKRIAEASRLGITTCVCPGASKSSLTRLKNAPEYIFVDSVSEAIDVMFTK
ncbi:MAG TPA: DNA repair protein RadA [Bacillota bacterium]|nr:DNA repair protein RadA [Bacillota bacterium]HPE38326.1 DNA repair protein RadA [Bacillota bacterium]